MGGCLLGATSPHVCHKEHQELGHKGPWEDPWHGSGARGGWHSVRAAGGKGVGLSLPGVESQDSPPRESCCFPASSGSESPGPLASLSNGGWGPCPALPCAPCWREVGWWPGVGTHPGVRPPHQELACKGVLTSSLSARPNRGHDGHLPGPPGPGPASQATSSWCWNTVPL